MRAPGRKEGPRMQLGHLVYPAWRVGGGPPGLASRGWSHADGLGLWTQLGHSAVTLYRLLDLSEPVSSSVSGIIKLIGLV